MTTLFAADVHAGPFLTRDNNPFTQVYGQPLPTAARLPRTAELKYAFSLDITNTLNTESLAGETLYVDYEAYVFTLGGIHGLNERWALKLDAPFIYRSGGMFDHAIDEWHKFFNLPRSGRPDVEDNQFSTFYSNTLATTSNTGSSQSGIGDAQLGLGRSLYRTPQYALSLWASVDLPVGDANSLTGNDDLDYSLWLAGAGKIGELSSVDANLGAVLPGDSVIIGLETEDLVIFGHAGGHIALNRTLALKLQLAGHSGYYRNTSIEFLGSTMILIFGGAINIGKCSSIDIGISEDIKAGTSADVGLLISWKSQFNAC
ncbi:MAG: DUF3187 family protein [Arenicella sp.]|nr:DUF3187 family protein [Arenicella sp.]MBT8129765.1 DUF3187 family protein [Gammaproteobacteria bacterium]